MHEYDYCKCKSMSLRVRRSGWLTTFSAKNKSSFSSLTSIRVWAGNRSFSFNHSQNRFWYVAYVERVRSLPFWFVSSTVLVIFDHLGSGWYIMSHYNTTAYTCTFNDLFSSVFIHDSLDISRQVRFLLIVNIISFSADVGWQTRSELACDNEIFKVLMDPSPSLEEFPSISMESYRIKKPLNIFTMILHSSYWTAFSRSYPIDIIDSFIYIGVR
jgi:hypothetical protein